MINEKTNKRLHEVAKELERIAKKGLIYNATIKAMLKANEAEALFTDFDFLCEVRMTQIVIKKCNERLEKLSTEWEEE